MPTIDNKTKLTLLSLFYSLDKESIPNRGDGWVNLANFGSAIKKAEVDFRSMGFERLKDFVTSSGVFKIWTDDSREAPVIYIQLKSSYQRASEPTRRRIANNNSEVDKVKKRLRLVNNFFIGQFSLDGERGHYKITDIRNTDFTKIEDKERGIKDLTIRFESSKNFSKFAYYRFTWNLISFSPLEFGIDLSKEVKLITSHDVVYCINNCLSHYPLDAAKKITGSLDTLSKQLTQSGKKVFIYELLQNANDYPQIKFGKKQLVDVEFHITEDFLVFLHTGDYFNAKNVAAICNINDGEKSGNEDAIGYKGIGFKTVFLDSDYVFLQSGTYTFRFDKAYSTSEYAPINTPWQIYPLWTNPEEVSDEITSIFSSRANDEFRVKFALKPRDSKILTNRERKDNYIDLFSRVFENERVMLFIPKIRKVSIFIGNSTKPVIVREKNSQDWCVSPAMTDDVPEFVRERINDVLTNQGAYKPDGYDRIPEKYRNFYKTSVKFACKRDGRKLVPIEDAILYCYLPADKADWGFKFLMNTDMIPNGARDDIEDIELNHEIAKIAGRQFFYWIKELIASKEYDLGSIFALIPDFEECAKKKPYAKFIREFQEEFETLIKEEPFVPVVDIEGNESFACIDTILDDRTGITEKSVMTDDEFRKFSDMEDYYLPLPILRNDKHFISFLKRYTEADQRFKFENLKGLIANEDFQEWLKVQENNNKFLKFLLDNDYLQDLLEEEIFLEDEGSLYAAADLYYDVDKYLLDLQAFTDNIYFLSPKTRQFFKDNEEWSSVVDGAFAQFDCEVFVNNILLSSKNKSTTNERLKDKNTSIHFYKFLSENVGYCDEYLELPFFNDSNEVVEEFNEMIIFMPSKRGHDICNKEWLTGVAIEFISSDYDNPTKEYFKANFGVQDFTDEYLVENVILSDEYQGCISEAINDDFEISKDFLLYCYSQKELFNTKSLGNISLKVFDGDGEEQWYIAEGDVFFPSSTFDFYSKKPWVDASWMVVLDEAYLNGINNPSELKKFIGDSFGVEELVDKNFYENIVKQHLNEIFDNISGQNDADGAKNIDFVRYLDDNYQLIFEQKKDYDKFEELVLVTSSIHDVGKSEGNLYVYDTELNDIINCAWFPDGLVKLCHPDYGPSNALKRIGVKTYSFRDFYDEVIAEKLDSINEHINSKEDSIAFHHFIIAHLSQLTDEQITKMQRAKVFLYGQDNPVGTASGHNILSASAKELLNLGLVEFSDLDILDPDYEPEKDSGYWGTRLENTKFTTSHFMNWLKNNLSSFAKTLEDKDLNIAFWRWLKDNVTGKLIDETASLPVMLKDGSIDAERPVYFSDEYMEGAGIEQSVKIFDDKAKFLSPDYMSEDDDKEQWRSFFSKAEIKYEIVDILVLTVIPQLSEIDDSNLPKLIAENREKLETHFDGGLIPQITRLRVKAHDGKFYDICDTIYIDCEKEEPFPYIKLPNQISFGSAEERRLIKDIIDKIDGDCVTKLREWRQRKLDCYLDMQDEDSNSVRDFHYQFINDLSIIRNNNRDTLKEIENIENIQLLNKDDEFCVASTLTMGTVYNPFFDFEECGVGSLDYVSDTYSQECTEYVGRFFRDLNVHCDFEEEDIELLEDRVCAVYFWGTYLFKKDASISRIKQFISDNLFDDFACIPTKDYMKCASELYYGDEVSRYIKNIEDGDNKVPLRELPDVKLSDGTTLFSKLPFKDSLDFLDALYALINVSGQDKRTQLLRWMIDSYDEKYDEVIRRYRDDEHALWYNNRNELVQIRELYALDYSDKALEQYFGTNPRIINRLYLPVGDSFREACDILGITTITSDDLTMEPVGDFIYTARDFIHKLYALVIAGMTDAENWKKLYEGYCQKLDELVLHQCTSILITYTEDNEINQSLKRFYHKLNDNNFYFVNNLDNKRVFKSFVEEFIKFLGIGTDEIDEDVIEDIMDSPENATEIIKEQNHLMLDEEFKDELDKLRPGIKQSLTGKKAAEDDDDNSYRPSFPIQDGADYVDEESKEDFEGRHDDGEEDSTQVEINGPTGEEMGGRQPRTADGDTSNPQQPREPHSDGHSGGHEGQSKLSDGRNEGNRNGTVGSWRNGDDKPTSTSSGSNGSRGTNTGLGMQYPTPTDKENLDHLRSQGIPLELESLPPTQDEIDILSQYDISAEQIADTNYLVRLRLYQNLFDRGDEPEDTMEDFVRKARNVTDYRLKSGKWIRTYSAASGVMYISPTIWNMMLDDKCTICVYLDGRGKNFHYIDTPEEFLQLVEKDDVVIKITGKEKVDVVKELYSGLLEKVKGTAYTLVRVASRTNMDAVFAHYVGAMAEEDDGNDTNEY